MKISIATKESVCIRKEFNSHRIVLERQYSRRDVIWKRTIVTPSTPKGQAIRCSPTPHYRGVCIMVLRTVLSLESGFRSERSDLNREVSVFGVMWKGRCWPYCVTVDRFSIWNPSLPRGINSDEKMILPPIFSDCKLMKEKPFTMKIIATKQIWIILEYYTKVITW